MCKGRVFDIEEAQWTEESKEVRYCVFQASKKVTVQYYEIGRGKSTQEICAPSEILVLCEHGICDYIINGKRYTVNDGVWCWIPAGCTYSVTNHDGSTAVTVRYYLPAWEQLPESSRIVDRGHDW